MLVLGPPLEFGVMEFSQQNFPAQQLVLESGSVGAGRFSNLEQLSDIVSRKLASVSRDQALPHWPRKMGNPVHTDRRPD